LVWRAGAHAGVGPTIVGRRTAAEEDVCRTLRRGAPAQDSRSVGGTFVQSETAPYSSLVHAARPGGETDWPRRHRTRHALVPWWSVVVSRQGWRDFLAADGVED
jgi:hypothetical protein